MNTIKINEIWHSVNAEINQSSDIVGLAYINSFARSYALSLRSLAMSSVLVLVLCSTERTEPPIG